MRCQVVSLMVGDHTHVHLPDEVITVNYTQKTNSCVRVSIIGSTIYMEMPRDGGGPHKEDS